ncbi:MAG: hypothetical protein IK126_03215 [Bacteroidales bacterium]|nr:hypothetical protein [Bacteroidales bacterium]
MRWKKTGGSRNLKYLEQEFITKGGIKERMHAARTGYREEQDRRLRELEEENRRLKAENEELRKKLERLV